MYLDEYTQEALPQIQIREAIMEDMCYFNSEVWQGVHIDEARQDKDGKILSGQWILSNKGDLEHPDCRARYVACEVRTYDDSAFSQPHLHWKPSASCFPSGQPSAPGAATS